MPHILLLSSAEIDENIALNDDVVTKLNARLGEACTVEWQNYHNIGLELSRNQLRAFIVSDGRDLSEFATVYFKSIFRYHEQATAIAETLDFMHVPFVGKELRHYIPAYKLSQMARLAKGNVTIPHTLYLPLEHYVPNYDMVVKKLGVPFIFKAINGSTGDDNYLVKDKAQLETIAAKTTGMHFIAQKFVPNESDLRVLIVGGRIGMVIERKRADDSTHLNNTSKGATAHLLPLETLDPALQELGLRAAEIMERDVAGVDVMLEKGSGVPYVLEVNASPQITSGSFEAEKLDLYTEYFKGLVG